MGTHWAAQLVRDTDESEAFEHVGKDHVYEYGVLIHGPGKCVACCLSFSLR